MTALIFKIVSGGQTGADRAALDFAMARCIPHGGWCPKGRKAADGVLDLRYQLDETPSAGYAQRTKWNVRDSDGTLVVNKGELIGGSLLTTKFAARLAKPYLVVQVDCHTSADLCARIRHWVESERIRVLNVAGPREEKAPGIYAETLTVLNSSIAGA